MLDTDLQLTCCETCCIEARRRRGCIVVLDEPRLVDVARAGSAGSAVYSKA